MELVKPYKLGVFVEGSGWTEHVHAGVYRREPNVLLVAPSGAHVDLIVTLLECVEGPFRLVYNLLVDCEGHPEGTYRSRDLFTRDELVTLLQRFADFFEKDARHEVIVTSAEGAGYLQYTQHNTIEAYGPLECYAHALGEAGLREGSFELPFPHTHHFHDELDTELGELLGSREWDFAPAG